MSTSLRRLLGLFAALVFVAGFAPRAFADEGTVINGADLAVTIPEGWSGRLRDVIQLTTDEEDAWIYLWALNDEDFDNALTHPTDYAATVIENPKLASKKLKAKQEGAYELARFSGTGTVSGVRVSFNGVIIKTEKAPAVILGMADGSTWKKKKDDLEKIVQSVRPAVVE